MEMDAAARPLWRGRILTFTGILLVALNLRTAVAALSPIARDIGEDIPLDDILLGALGMIPPVAFAIAGLFSPRAGRRLGLESLLALAMAALALGHVVRALGDSSAVLAVGGALALLGTGVGNVLVPPLVKRYFPDRIGLLTGLYITMITFSAAIPAALAAPISAQSNWRVSVGIWAVLAIASLVPWCVVLVHERRRATPATLASATLPLPGLARGVWRSPLAWALGVTAAVSSFNFFAIFAWLPEMLIQTAGQTPLQAGALLALYSIVGCPASLLVPLLVVRMKRPGLIVQVSVLSFVAGYIGLMAAPAALPWLWALLLSGGQTIFPVCLVLVNLRSRTPAGSVALSGFSQAVGYGVAACGPLIIGFLRDATHGWTAAYVLLIVVSLPALITGALLNKNVMIEDEVPRLRKPRQGPGDPPAAK